MQRIPLFYRTSTQTFLFAVLNLLSRTTSVIAALTSSETIPSLLLINDDSPNNNGKPPSNTSITAKDQYNQTSQALRYSFVIAAIFVTSFCILVLYLQRRKKTKTALKENVEDANFHMNSLNGINTSGDCQRRAERNNVLCEGLNAHGEAPPPYTISSKLPRCREVDTPAVLSGTDDAIITGQELSTVVDPPAYNEHAISGQNQNAGDTSSIRN